MVDDKKKHQTQDNVVNQGHDQQKGGEATKTDQDITDLNHNTQIPTDTSKDEKNTDDMKQP